MKVIQYHVVPPQTHPDEPTRHAIFCYALPPDIAQQVAAILAGTHHAIYVTGRQTPG